MVSISLNNQIFFTSLITANSKPKGPKPDYPAAGNSQNYTVLISNDDKSDYNDFDNGQSDTFFLSIDELLRQYTKRQGVEFSNVAGADIYLNSLSFGQIVRLIRLNK